VVRTERGRRLLWGGIAGIVFAVAFVVGVLLATDTPEGDESNAEWRRYFADSGNRRMIIIGVFVLALAALAFLVFLGVLRERLRSGATATSSVSTVAFASGIAFVTMVALFAAGVGAIPGSVEFGDNPLPPDANIMRTFESVGIGALLLFGAVTAGLLTVTTSIAARRVALFPRWLVIAGYVIGVIVILGGWLFIPMGLFVLWMLAVSIVLLMRSRPAAAD
jgi:hypothetical protein